MEGYDIENCLNSMTILVDTREQPSERAEKRYKSFFCSYKRQKLDYGDYSVTFMDSEGNWPKVPVAIERKMNLDELAQCFTRERKRFQAEFERAKADNAKMYLLVENASWENLILGKYKSKYNSKAFLASILSWSIRYDLKIIFCKSETSGKLIGEILYRELKARLERGDFG